jgi:predicted Ser/Thr protein kinase
MITSIRKIMNNNQPLVSAYQYDQLNRIIEAKYFNQTNSTTPTISATNEWNNVFSYDPNGNILTQMRKGYGETKLSTACPCEHNAVTNCTDMEYQAQRNTEFVIVK